MRKFWGVIIIVSTMVCFVSIVKHEQNKNIIMLVNEYEFVNEIIVQYSDGLTENLQIDSDKTVNEIKERLAPVNIKNGIFGNRAGELELVATLNCCMDNTELFNVNLYKNSTSTNDAKILAFFENLFYIEIDSVQSADLLLLIGCAS